MEGGLEGGVGGPGGGWGGAEGEGEGRRLILKLGSEQAEANSYQRREEEEEEEEQPLSGGPLALCSPLLPASLGAPLPPPSNLSLPACLPAMPPASSLPYRSSPAPILVGTHPCSPLASQGLGPSSSSIKTSWVDRLTWQVVFGAEVQRQSLESPTNSGSEHH